MSRSKKSNSGVQKDNDAILNAKSAKNFYNGYSDSGQIVDVSALSYEDYCDLRDVSPEERQKRINALVVDKSKARCVAPMSALEELAMVLLFGLGVPGSVITIPLLATLVAYMTGAYLKTFVATVALLLPIALWPLPHYHVSNKESRLAYLMLRYFSFKVVRGGKLPENDLETPVVLVAPPHGVFPFGNILTMIGYPTIMGYDFTGLAASAVFRTPIFRQWLTLVGASDVGKENMMRLLSDRKTVGISTGGVAEVFETNSPDGNEVILLSERKGLVKLAMKTGADLVPCYLFGNTQLLSLWTGGSAANHNFLKRLSRKIGFALIMFWGRFGLPIPYRVPILGVMGNRIKVDKCSEPSSEEIDRVHAILCKEMVELFDKYKGDYGWEDKKLIIV